MNSERFIVYNLLSKSDRGLGIIKEESEKKNVNVWWVGKGEEKRVVE